MQSGQSHELNAFTLGYSILAFGSHPDLGNDDCWYGEDCATFQEVTELLGKYIAKRDSSVAYFQIDSWGFHYICKNPFYRPRKRDDEWRNEIATQAGMLGGVEAYNEVMGY